MFNYGLNTGGGNEVSFALLCTLLFTRVRMHGQGLTRETGYNSVARSQVR